ncbi:hypothetical protein NL108_001682, partial [Boleophthalmus pectinirostris]
AVDLRNQKIAVNSGNSQVTKLSSSITMPTLSHLTVCFEAQRSSTKQKEWLFSYYDSSNGVALSFGANQEEMYLIVDGRECSVDSLMTQSNLTSSMTPVCVVWTSASGKVVLYYNNQYLSKSCSALSGRSVPAGGLFQLGGQHNFEGYIYNLRLWDYSMSQQQLSALTCDTQGNVIDWDNSYWDVPSTMAQTDASLSCTPIHFLPRRVVRSLLSQPPHFRFSSPTVRPPAGTTARAPRPQRHRSSKTSLGLFYRVAFVVEDSTLTMSQADVEEAVVIWLNQTFQNWTQSVYVDFISYQCQALLIHYFTTNESLEEAAKTRLSNYEAQLGTGLRIQTDSSSVSLIYNCPEEVSVHYRWPESRPTVSHTLPCFPNKDSSTSRTCYTFCTENAAEVAGQLVVITNNELSQEEVSQVVIKVKELVNVAKINTTLAHTVVTIISNVMKRPETTLPATSEKALKAVDKLAQKIEFEGDTVSITSKHLAVGVSSLNTAMFKGTNFSAFIGPNSSQPQVLTHKTLLNRANPLAQVTLPASLLANISLTETERASLSRINFMFFSSTNLFQKEQDGLSLNSYVVASSVGNFTISNLRDPIRIEIAHLTEQVRIIICMYYECSLVFSNGDGGWNREGCHVSAESTRNKTVCLCNHLTHFGILMDIYGSSAYINERNTKILTFITYIGCGISAVFSAVTLLTYIAFEKLRRDYPSKILMNLSTSLLCLNLTFLLDGWLASLSSDWLCVSVAVFLHYFLLTSFTWMGLESIHMYIALVKVFNTYIRRYILKFCLVGWGLPAVIVGTVAAIDNTSYGVQEYGKGASGHGSSEFCWIKDPVVFYITCVGYFCLIFLLNVAMFIVVMLQICGRNGKRSNRTLREEVLRNLRSVISLTFLLGMTWGFAFFAWGPVNLAFMYLFSIFNSLQGLFIFIFHCALKENVQKQWRRYLCCGRFRLSDNSDWSKTATNNTKKVSSENLGKSLSSSSFGSSTANWTSKAKATLNPFSKRHSNT